MPEAKEVVVFVHGLYMTGVEMSLLRARVRHAGFETRQFHYHTVLDPVRDNAQRLADYLAKLEAPVVHLVGHSLGGLIILRMFESRVDLPPGRVVLLGSPVNGSAAARELVARHLGWALGRSGRGGLLEERVARWNGERDLAVIAGTGGFGFHPYRPRLARPHDGLVAVEETRIAGAVYPGEVETTHLGLLFNPQVAARVRAFLEERRFSSQKFAN